MILVSVSDLWRAADKASERFAAQALDYDRYRPRYPDEVFDDLVESVGLTCGDKVVEIGAGTGIATEPLVERGTLMSRPSNRRPPWPPLPRPSSLIGFTSSLDVSRTSHPPLRSSCRLPLMLGTGSNHAGPLSLPLAWLNRVAHSLLCGLK